MTSGMKIRLAAFVSAITLLVSLIVWVAVTSARLIEEARAQMNLAQSESFRIAGQFQKGILALNERLLQFARHHDLNEWREFEKEWAAKYSIYTNKVAPRFFDFIDWLDKKLK